jgi:hypothetical protein
MATLDPGVTGKRRRGAARKQARPQKARAPPTTVEKGKNEETKRKPRPEPAAGTPLMSIPAAGKKYFGLSKNGSYGAAERGDFGKLYEVGRLRFAVIPALEAKIKAVAEAKQPEAA